MTIEDTFISVYTDNNQILRYDYDFNIVSSHQLNTIQANNFKSNALISIENSYFLSGTTEKPMFNGSNFLSNKDFLIRKTNTNQEVLAYTFSGIGTSNIYQLGGVVVRDTAYAFTVYERLGPSNYSPGGTIAPSQKHFLTYDKNLNLLEDLSVPDDEILYTNYETKKLEGIYNNGDQYKYKVNTDTTKVSLYKNNNLIWERNINIAYPEVINNCEISKKGDFLISSAVDGYVTGRLRRLSLNNSLDVKDFSDVLDQIIPMANNWLFLIDNTGSIKILSDRLNIINTSSIPYGSSSNGLFLKEKNNHLILHPYGTDKIYVYNQFGEKQENLYHSININPNSSIIEYDDNYLISINQIGAGIYLHPEYSWQRAIIKKYNLDISNTIPDLSSFDDDGDGVPNSVDECRNTDNGNIVDANGCSVDQIINIAPTDIKVIVNDSTCPEKSNGAVNISFEKDYTYKVTLIGDDENKTFESINHSSGLEISDLPSGTYKICITVAESDFFKQCYNIKIKAPEALRATKISSNNNEAVYKVSGSKFYIVTVNNEEFEYSFNTIDKQEIKINLINGANSIEIKTSKVCQGTLNKSIINGEITLYPVPVNEYLNIAGISENKAKVIVSSLAGTEVLSTNIEVKDGIALLSMNKISAGSYIVTVITSTKIINTKILKK